MNPGRRSGPGWVSAVRVVTVGCCLVMAACTDRCPLDATEQRVVARWLDCGDCLEGELDSLVALAGRKPERSLVALRMALLEGPGQARLTRYTNSLDSSFTRDSANVTAPAMTREAYVGRFRENYRASYRKRAASALARVGTPAADAALDSALQHSYVGADTLRKDVREFLARMRQWSPPPPIPVLIP